MAEMYKVFISHTYNQGIEDIKDALVGYEFVGDNFSAGSNISIAVSKAIEECDVFIAVVNESENSKASIFEAGIAFASQKIVIMLYDRTHVPPYSNLDRYITISRDNLEMLTVAVNRLTSRKYDENFIKLENSNIKSEEQNIIKDNLKNYPVRKFNNNLEREFYYLLEKSGSSYKIIEQPGDSNKKNWTPDFAVWIDSVDDAIGNPIMFEIVSYLNVEKALKLRDTVNKYLRRQIERNLIVVYQDGSDEEIINQEVSGVNMSFIKLSTLEREIDEIGLAKTVIKTFVKGY